MRWHRLFDDLEAQLDGEVADALDAELADRVRGELAKTSLEDRLRGALGRAVTLELAGVGPLRGTLRKVGSGWLIVDEPNGTATIALVGAVIGARGLPVAARDRAADGIVGGRIGIGHVMRVLARDRTPTAVAQVDGTWLAGTIDRVGTDYFDLAEHPLDEARRFAVGSVARTVAVAVVAALRPMR
ncbi:MAG TPA: hypothetical protein VHV76_06210 [Mycobacteriales bacterium]|jgi:hypothetical protein|nr:hypothetical protein [Mycobacteriales bacterium]